MEIWFHQAQICLIAFSSSNCILFYLVCILFYPVCILFYPVLFYSTWAKCKGREEIWFHQTTCIVPWICCLKAFPSSNCILFYLVCIVFYLSAGQKEKKRKETPKAAKEKVEYNTRDSNVVPHRSTNRARTCLTSLSRREAVLSCWYGRTHQLDLSRSIYMTSQVGGKRSRYFFLLYFFSLFIWLFIF